MAFSRSGTDATRPLRKASTVWRDRLGFTLTAWLLLSLGAVVLALLLVTLLRPLQ